MPESVSSPKSAQSFEVPGRTIHLLHDEAIGFAAVPEPLRTSPKTGLPLFYFAGEGFAMIVIVLNFALRTALLAAG
jgi:hypothetical protein